MVHRSVRVWVLAVLGAAGVSLWATWPLAAHLGTHVYDPSSHRGFFAESIRADVRLVLWILAWDLHALTTAPAGLWDANIFHPAPGTLALSEHLLGALPLYAPLALATGDPVLAHQATLLATFVGALLTMLALVRAFTGSWPAAILAASLFAFSPFRGGHLGALQIEGCWMLPLVLLAAWRSVTTRGLAWPTAFGLALALVALHSVYLAYGVFAGVAACVVVVVALDAEARARWPRLVLPLLAAATVVADIARPYLAMRQGGTLAPPRGEFVALTSAPLGQTGATLAVVLALLTLPWWRRGLVRDVRPAWIIGVLVAAFLSHALALGPTMGAGVLPVPGPYTLAASLIPGFAALRIPSRFNALVTACAALLAGVGMAGAARSCPTTMKARVSILTIALAFAAARIGLPRPFPLEAIETRDTLPPVYAALARAAPGAVLELPWHDFDRIPTERGVDAQRTYRSVYHWHPLLNGYSGYAPRTYPLVSALVHALPDREAWELLARATGVRYVLLDPGALAPDRRVAWDRLIAEQLTPMARDGGHELYALRDPQPADLLQAFVANETPATTLLGAPLAALGPDARVAQVRAVDATPRTARSRLRFAVPVQVTNASARTWPAAAAQAPHLVTVGSRWVDADGRVAAQDDVAGRLPTDLAPGATVPVLVGVQAPGTPGPWRLVVGAVQDGVWFDGETLSIPLTVR